MAAAKRSGPMVSVLSAMARVTGADNAGVTNDLIVSSTAAWVILGAVTAVLAGTVVVESHPWVIAATQSGVSSSTKGVPTAAVAAGRSATRRGASR